MYFTQSSSGAITAVHAHQDDDEDVVTLKTAIVYALNTPKYKTASDSMYSPVGIVDPVGLHVEYVRVTPHLNRIVVDSYYNEDDVDFFVDENMDEADVMLEGSSEKVLVEDRVTSSYSDLTVILNKAENIVGSNDDDEDIVMTTMGTSHLYGYAVANNAEVDFPFKNGFEHLESDGSLRRVPRFTREWYKGRQSRKFKMKSAPLEDGLDGFAGCPSEIDICRGFDNSWTVGNNNAGIRFSLSGTAGIKKGCKAEHRSYMAGAYAKADILVVGQSISAVDAFVEYGLVNGSPLKNAISLKLFGKSIYTQNIPNLDCTDKTIQLKKWDKSFSFGFTIVVYIVPITFSVGLDLNFDSYLQYTICPAGLKASLIYVPSLKVTLKGGASASIAVARAGIEIRGAIRDWLNPTIYVDGNTCQVGFTLYNNVDPIEVGLYAYYQLRTVKFKKLIPRIEWGKQHSLTIWKHTWGGSKQQIINLSHSAK
jgi:hypothetical protein